MDELETIKVKGITFGRRTATWAGPSWNDGRFLFGTDDGFILETGEDAPIPDAWAMQVADEREAVNGVVWAIDGPILHLAVSTRSEIKAHRFDTRVGAYSADRLPRGAHGLYPTRFGGFVAPLGPDGLLSCHPGPGNSVIRAYLPATGDSPYFYDLAPLGRMTGESEVFAAACRTDGLLGVRVSPLAAPSRVKWVRPRKKIDNVCVCPIGNDAHPRALVALGRSGAIGFTLDFIDDNNYKTLHFGGLLGTAYKVAVVEQQLLILTSEGLYWFSGQVDAFLRGEPIGGEVQVRHLAIDAFDISVVSRRWLLVLTPENVIRIPAGEFSSQGESSASGVDTDRGRLDSTISSLGPGQESSPNPEWRDFPLETTLGTVRVPSE